MKLRLPDLSSEQKRWLVSSLNTFLAGFCLTLGFLFEGGADVWQGSFWAGLYSLFLTGARGGFKFLFEKNFRKYRK